MTKAQKLDHKRTLARERQRRSRANKARGIRVASPASTSPVVFRKVPLATSSQLVSMAAQSSVVSAMNAYVFRKVDGAFYEMLREAIPIFDSAIRQSITLEGFLKPIGDDPDLVRELEDFFLNVPVNDMQKGIQAFQECTSNEKFEQGFAITEFVANKKRDDIDRLVVADSKSIFFRRNAAGRAEPWFRSGAPKQTNYTMPASVIDQILNVRYGRSVSYNGVVEVRLVPDNKNYFSIGNENQDPHGVSIMRSTEFVSQIIVTIQNGFKHIAERYGDPMHHVHYKAGKSGGDLETRRKAIQDDFNAIVTAKRQGKSGDLVTAGGPDSDVKVEVIGGQGQIYTFDIPLRHLLEQIVAKTNLPAWLLGIYWSTTERMATLEIEAALSSAKIRQLAMLPEYIKLCANFLRLRGRTWDRITTSVDSPGDWGLVFESPSYRDVMTMANARFLNAQASLMERGVAGAATTTSVQVGGATFELGRQKQLATEGTKVTKVISKSGSSLSPLPSEGEGRVRGADSQSAHKCRCGSNHSAFRNTKSTIEDVKEATRPTPWPILDKLEAEYETRLKSDWVNLKVKCFDILKLKIPDPSNKSTSSYSSKAFEYTDDQRAAILKILKDYLGIYNADDLDSPVMWYYAQSYSAGLIRAVEIIGKERPILDILKNSEIYADLVANGFQLVKDNATIAIKNEILDQMENSMLQGDNPRNVAEKLSARFDGQNSDWERLARTEMAGAAERAKLDEWSERDINVRDMYTTDGDCIVPVHPRCRCSTTISETTDGSLVGVFAPAPDACPLCLSMQEGDKRLWNADFGLRNENHPAHSSDQSYEKITAALEKIADRPINIKIEQSPMQLALTLDKTPMNYEMEKDPKTGKVKMKQVAEKQG